MYVVEKFTNNATNVINHFLLCPHGAVDDEVDGAVDDETEVLDCCQSEHPAGMNRQLANLAAHISPLCHARLKKDIEIVNL